MAVGAEAAIKLASGRTHIPSRCRWPRWPPRPRCDRARVGPWACTSLWGLRPRRPGIHEHRDRAL